MGAERVWAVEEFGDAVLGDARRTARLVALATAAAAKPHGRITQTLSDAAAREAAYRFVENDGVEPRAVGEAMFRACARRCAGQSSVVVAVDQSTISVIDRDGAKGLGRVGTRFALGGRRGFEVMSAVALLPRRETVGLLSQHWHLRAEERSPSDKQDRRPVADRESGLWAKAFGEATAHLAEYAPGTRPWFQMDRGADAGHVLQAASQLDIDFTVRSSHNRRLDTGGRLRSSVLRSRVLGRVSVELPSEQPGRRRQATFSVRARRVTIRLQTTRLKRLGALSLNVVHIREVGPGRRRRIEWFLLTNVSTPDLDSAWAVAETYMERWRVEEFHRSWKRGVCDVESSQLRSASAFRRWATILAAVAARAERLKTLSREYPERDAVTEFTRDELDAAIALSHTRHFRAGDDLTLEQAVDLVARAGGYIGKSSGGPPGARTIGRGLERVRTGAEVLKLHRNM